MSINHSHPKPPATTSSLMQTFFRWIREQGITDTELAHRMGWSPKRVWAYRSGASAPSIPVLERMMIAVKLECICFTRSDPRSPRYQK